MIRRGFLMSCLLTYSGGFGVSHLPAWMRVTTWTVTRDLKKEAAIFEKVKQAREYFEQVIAEFDKSRTK